MRDAARIGTDAAIAHDSGVHAQMVARLRDLITEGRYEREFNGSAPLALHAMGFTAAEVTDHLDAVCAEVFGPPQPDCWRSIGDVAAALVRKLQA